VARVSQQWPQAQPARGRRSPARRGRGLHPGPAESGGEARAGRDQRRALMLSLGGLVLCLALASSAHAVPAAPEATKPPPDLELSAVPPADIPGGAPNANLHDAARFAWQVFVALNWAAAPQTGAPGTRGAPDLGRSFGDPAYFGPLVW
jgi:hypothetical protein